MVTGTSGPVSRFETSLAPLPTSVRTARRFVRATLAETTADGDRVDSAELLVSELVTNALVHAGSQIGLAVDVFVDAVRIQVADDSPDHPVRRQPDESATTGRGWQLVELLADDFGVADSRTGKVSWFTLGPVPAVAADLPPQQLVETPGEHSVVLAAVPPQLFAVWQQHASSAVRETLLMSFADDSADPAQQERQAQAGRAGDAVSALFRATVGPEFDVEPQGRRVDVVLPATDGLAAQFSDLREVLERCVALSRQGSMLAPPAPPEVVQFRSWVCDEVARQSQGADPVRWPEKAPPIEDLAHLPVSRLGDVDVSQAPDALIAADDSNRIIAVSESAASLLGWQPHELVGQRLITIIPERLHESHIVGFLRFLLTGKTSILGSPVTVPARHADGSEVSVVILIRVLPGTGTRRAFVAELKPVT